MSEYELPASPNRPPATSVTWRAHLDHAATGKDVMVAYASQRLSYIAASANSVDGAEGHG